MSRFLPAIAFVLFASLTAFSQTPAAVERELIGHLDNIKKFGNYGTTVDDQKLSKNNEDLESKLLKYGKRADILRYPFAKLKAKMSVTTSKDGSLRIYSWDSQTGGTAHWQENVFQFRGKGGKVFAEGGGERVEGDACNGFYHQIFQTDTPGGRVYLANSTAQCSTSLNQQTIEAFRIVGDKLDTKAKAIKTRSGVTNQISFAYDFFSAVDHRERPIRLFSYNDSTKTFRFPIVIRDRKTPQGRVTNRFISYRFDGQYFVKVG
jgi:hypothetical protein